MEKFRIGLYPGTFDPITNGHLDIIQRSSKLVDKLIVGIANNIDKSPMFSAKERIIMVQDEIRSLNFTEASSESLEVCSFDNLLMHFAEEVNASIIFRGLRAVSDFDYEFQMVGMNARLNPNIETVFLMASENQQFISSRFVKEIALLNGDVSSFVSQNVLKSIYQYMNKTKRSE